MTLLAGWLTANSNLDCSSVVDRMGCALRVHARQEWACWVLPHLGVGLLEFPGTRPVKELYAPAIDDEERFYLWMVGEAFAGGDLLHIKDAEYTRTSAFRKALLESLLRNGPNSVRELDGEYQIVLWDSKADILMLMNDRFGGLPLYWSRTSEGFGFAGGVRGLLTAPSVTSEPDPEAIREAVTFGGYRLGDRTNIESVKMMPPATIMTVENGYPSFRRYWHWSEIPPVPRRSLGEYVEEVYALWQRAVCLRLSGGQRPGQLLSGGLDSRAILAEAAPKCNSWTTITYGIPSSDDVRYAQKAANKAGVTWVYYPLYCRMNSEWLEHRTQFIHETDGLIDLQDLKYLETVTLQTQLLDLHLSGYIGDAVIGPTFNEVTTPEGVLGRLPFYKTAIGLPKSNALELAEELIARLRGASARFVLFEHKLPQSTNRWVSAFKLWLRTRKPFTDYQFFDFAQGLPEEVRSEKMIYERWLATEYPGLFRNIPNQRTGMPIMTPQWRIQIERARRLAMRKLQPNLRRIGVLISPRRRYYDVPEIYWRTPETARRIKDVILRPGSISVEVFGKRSLNAIVYGWFERVSVPTQVIAALYVYEVYHSDLKNHLIS